MSTEEKSHTEKPLSKEIEASKVGVYWVELQMLLRFSWVNTEYPTIDKSTSKIPTVLKP